MKKIFAILFAIVLCFAFGVVAMAAQEQQTTALDLTTRETVNNLTAKGWAWNATTKTLTLDGLNLLVTDESAIIAPNGTTIVLAADSTNKITTSGKYGISAQGSLIINGRGTLNITAASYGIQYLQTNPVTINKVEFDFSDIILNIVAIRGVKVSTEPTVITNTALAMTNVNYKFTHNGNGTTVRSLQFWANAGNASINIKDSTVTGDGEIVVNGIDGATLSVVNSTVCATSDVFVQRAKSCTMVVDKSTFTTEASLLVGGGTDLAKVTVTDSSVTTGSKWKLGNNSFEIGNSSVAKAEVTFKNSTVTSIDGMGQALKIHTKSGGETVVDVSDSTFFLAGRSGENLGLIPDGNDFTVVAHNGATLSEDSNGNKTLALPAETKITSGGVEYTVAGNGTTMTFNAEIGAMELPAGTVLTLADGRTITSDGMLTFGVGQGPTLPAGVETTITPANGEPIKLTPTTNAPLIFDDSGSVEIPAGTKVQIGDNEPVYMPNGGTVSNDGKLEITPSPKPASCDHSFDANGKCKYCGIIVIDHTTENADDESNPNTGAESAIGVAAAVAAVALAGIAVSKKK